MEVESEMNVDARLALQRAAIIIARQGDWFFHAKVSALIRDMRRAANSIPTER